MLGALGAPGAPQEPRGLGESAGLGQPEEQEGLGEPGVLRVLWVLRVLVVPAVLTALAQRLSPKVTCG